MQDQVPAIAGGGNVQECELVSTLRVVAGGNLDRVAGVAQLDKVDAFYDTATGHVEAGDDSLGKHGGIVDGWIAG